MLMRLINKNKMINSNLILVLRSTGKPKANFLWWVLIEKYSRCKQLQSTIADYVPRV